MAVDMLGGHQWSFIWIRVCKIVFYRSRLAASANGQLCVLTSTGVISSTLVTIGSDLSNHPLTTLDESLITSCTSLFALVSSPFTGVLADRFGRRKVILAADALFAIGALVQASTSQLWTMIVGRSIVGLAVGIASAVTPL